MLVILYKKKSKHKLVKILSSKLGFIFPLCNVLFWGMQTISNMCISLWFYCFGKIKEREFFQKLQDIWWADVKFIKTQRKRTSVETFLKDSGAEALTADAIV